MTVKYKEPCDHCWPTFDRHCTRCLKLNPIEQEYNKTFTRYIPPSSKWWDGMYEIQPRGYAPTIARMHVLVAQGFTVRCGYAATSVKGFHDHIIFRK